VIQNLGGGVQVVRTGQLVRLLGDVDPAGRMARALVAVKNPLESEGGSSPLLIGSYVRVEVEGHEVDGVYQIPRRALREGERIWLVNGESRLDIRDVEVVFSKGDDVFIRGDFDTELRVVSSPLKGALRGVLLEVIPEEPDADVVVESDNQTRG